MKSNSPRTRSSSSPTAAASFHQTYLKPGALAQIRYSKINARLKKIGSRPLIELLQLESILSSAPIFSEALS